MKKRICFILFIISLLVVNSAISQNINLEVQRLIDLNLLNFYQGQKINKKISFIGKVSKGQLLYFVFQEEFEKVTGYKYSSVDTVFDFDEKLKKNEQKEINKLLFKYLTKLQKGSLINDKLYQLNINKIKNNEYNNLFNLLLNLINQISLDEWMSTTRQNNFRVKLFKNGIISKEKNNQLRLDISENKLKSPLEFINYCKNAKFFDLSKYSNEPIVYLKEIHELTSKILPELSFTNFKFEIKIDSLESSIDYTSHKLVVSIKSNNKTYKQKSFFLHNNTDLNDNFFIKIDKEKYYQVFNKILNDLKSNYQLHLVKYKFINKQKFENQNFGIIALREDQSKIFRDLKSYWNLSYENFDTSITTTKINDVISQFRTLGLFNHLDKNEVLKSIDIINEKKINDLNEILSSFSEVVLSFDTELSNLNNPYEELLYEYSKISHKEFNPIKVSDNFNLNNENVILNFIFNNKKYKKEFKINRDWIDTEFFKYLNDIAKKHNLSGKFYRLFGDGAVVIYLTSEQYNYIRENRLLIFADQ
ncbi:hypothetical protein [uncultured Tenacibaculum sp.]|uniref:hypothetical protein n=1 Tax=uncultured Tenacibaculum sp. TaxID=174713 RepID=UPI00262D7039|nr:hypothetical protein [uncultured Tenacibaculum sp.]